MPQNEKSNETRAESSRRWDEWKNYVFAEIERFDRARRDLERVDEALRDEIAKCKLEIATLKVKAALLAAGIGAAIAAAVEIGVALVKHS